MGLQVSLGLVQLSLFTICPLHCIQGKDRTSDHLSLTFFFFYTLSFSYKYKWKHGIFKLCVWFISLGLVISGASIFLQKTHIYPLWQNSVPRYVNTTFSPSIHLLRGIQATSKTYLLGMVLV